ncbi:PAS domain-containing protein [Bhargavaea beijingensis]|uniref:PAS domain S-box-containing protein n=1 Tax=Bhargavaea beijingensis TaxID=426756 RepID=A0A1G7B8L6_9BACL|nr:PAS domain-containing protein [Bhargavaea beijingensis]MCW1928396.1 PAS domain-containing protein [Bhargavaea beijingensis]RSK32635.1 PAS domain-containing protein [Bhargavaea beijingensis]SDE23353.1 PAS domain S-box-containing protein [Bhargavaea beijingensis]
MDPETQITLLEAMLDGSRAAALFTDPSQEDHPVIYANKTFEKLTGYSLDETIGHNCRFLQGTDTDPEAVQKIREAIRQETSVTVTLKNYKKDGTSFWNRVHIEPVHAGGRLYFIGTQTDVTVEIRQKKRLEEKEREIEHLSLPVLEIDDGIAAVSLNGEMSVERYRRLTVKLSEYVQEHHSHSVIIDISGLYWDDDTPIFDLLHIQDVLRLMGCRLLVTGISPKAARDIASETGPERPLTAFSAFKQAVETAKVAGALS